jgi:CheY-like chemotaxis protein
MELMAYLLTAFGHTPLMAFDGESGVRMAREELPDLILCDVHLPKLDGYSVVAALKGEPQLRVIPVLAVTALAMVGDRERLIEAGFNGYIAKPIEPEQFVAQLEPFLAAAGEARNQGLFPQVPRPERPRWPPTARDQSCRARPNCGNWWR